MEQLTFGACVKKSWSSARQAIVRMPVLFLGACVVFACIGLLSGTFQHAVTGSVRPAIAVQAGHGLLQFAVSILNFVVMCGLTIKIHRFVLLGEGSEPLMPLGGKPLARYAVIAFGLALLFMLVAMVVLLVLFIGFRPKWQGALLTFIPLCIVYFFVLVRLGLLFPALSVGARLKLRAAWNDSRGHFWSMWGVGVVTTVPLIAISTIIAMAGLHILASGQASQGMSIGLALINGLVTTLLIVLAAAASAWLYLRYAKQLRDAAGPGIGPHSGTAQGF